MATSKKQLAWVRDWEKRNHKQAQARESAKPVKNIPERKPGRIILPGETIFDRRATWSTEAGLSLTNFVQLGKADDLLNRVARLGRR